MKTLAYDTIVQTVKDLCIQAACDLPEDVLRAVRQAQAREGSLRAKGILAQLLENARIASAERIPLCQDTGLTVVFAEQGVDVVVDSGLLTDAIQDGVTLGYDEGLLRKSIVAEPLNERKNTKTNMPAVIHHRIVPGDAVEITVMLKGGGCENKSQFKMFNPTESKEAVAAWIVDVAKTAGANACPPFVVGVGLGGDFEYCCYLSKKALLREIGTSHADSFYAAMEADLLKAVNVSGLGPQGLGGDTTALAVHIETAGCHIASLPVAVNIECHSHRHKTAVL